MDMSVCAPVQVCICIYKIAYNCARQLRPTPIPVLPVLWAPTTGAQSNDSTCKHTESVVLIRLAYDGSSLVASSVPIVLGAHASELLEPGRAAPVAVLRRFVGVPPVSRSPSWLQACRWAASLVVVFTSLGTVCGRVASGLTIPCRRRWCWVRWEDA